MNSSVEKHNTTTENEQNPIANAEHVLAWADERLNAMAPVVEPLLETRHDLFDVQNSQISNEVPVSEQLYDEPTYNQDFVKDDLGVRKNGTLEFHNEVEKYDTLPNDDEEMASIKREYRQKILSAALELGFITPPSVSSNEFDSMLGIQDSDLEPIPDRVGAVVIASAAGLSNTMRVRDALRNIESGAIKTHEIIMVTCDRPVPEAERKRVEALGFTAGETEFDSALCALKDIFGAELTDGEDIEVPYQSGGKPAKSKHGSTVINGQEISIIALSAPLDTERTLADGRPAVRANSEDTFLAAQSLIEKTKGPIVVESHDTWKKYQEVIAQQTFALKMGKEVILAGPHKADRVFFTPEGKMDIAQAEAVIDEIAKVYYDLIKLRINALNQIANAEHEQA